MTKTVNINLLPWRAELREKRKKEFQTRSVLAGLLGVAAVFAGFMYFSQQLEQQQQVNEMIVAENAKLDTELKALEGLDKQRADIIERMKLIDGLQAQRPIIVHVADELVRLAPQQMHFTKIERKGDKFTIEGKAQDPNVVAELLRNLENSPWFRNAFMNAFVAADESVVKIVTNVINNVAQAETNPLKAQQLTSLVQRPEIGYGQFVVTVDLGDISKATVPVDAASSALPVDPNAPVQPVSANGQAQPTPAQSAPTNGQVQPAPAQPAQQPAPNAQASQSEPAPANGQAQPTPPANNQGAN